MKRIFVPTQAASDWKRLLAKPDLHWKPGRSAMSAALSWEGAGDKLPPEISALLDASQEPPISNLKLLAAIPEWEVPLPGGSRSSFTDVLALTRNEQGLCVIGVEAKVNEDFGPTLTEKGLEASPGQTQRLHYLNQLLGVPHFDGKVRYQLLHRTASALLTAKDFHADVAVMLIQSWGTNPELRRDFERFCEALGAEELPGGLKVVRRFQRPRLYLGWCDGEVVGG
ncbi:hypothetical protein [Caenimonas sp. SL110]|uniref:DUF6946 family protein n=1 Tax=Caenimonas sp. SL110 TaxID=1450524 RepID=UPI000653C08B|nr:hypothetical protein [Caenimonas sp. SL110]